MSPRAPLPRRRPRRYLPVFTLPVRDWNVHVYVRRPGVPGVYEVDPGWHPDGEGGLRRTFGQPTRIHGRLNALRAAQHRARPRPAAGRGGRVPDRPHPRHPHPPAAARYGPTLTGRNGNNSAHHYGNGTWLVVMSSLVYGDQLVHWWEYVYRSRLAALRAYQAAWKLVPTGYAAAAFRREEPDYPTD